MLDLESLNFFSFSPIFPHESSQLWVLSSPNVRGKHKRSVNFCNGGRCRSINVMPNCYCGDKAMLRTAKTAKNKGERFWGCPNFKVMLICNLCIVFV